jgi:tRNA modification GTPase
VVLWVEDCRFGPVPPPALGGEARWLRVGNKVDLVEGEARRDLDSRFDAVISARTGQGVDALVGILSSVVEQQWGGQEPGLVARERQRLALTECVEALRRSARTGDPELVAEELRAAGDALGRVAGRVDVEHVLDVIFAEFCIGK